MDRNKRQERKRKGRRSGGRKTSLPTTVRGDSAERAAENAADSVVAWIGDTKPSMPTTNGCALCEMAVADHCPGCHERLIECRGTAPSCVVMCVCSFCGLEFQDEGECPCLENM